MINELICYRCKCSKCKHLWTTKGHDLPKACPKCHRLTWNDDFDFRQLETSSPIPPPRTDDLLSAFIAKAQAKKGITQEITLPELVDEWAGWSEERSTIDHEAGETVYYRVQDKTGKRAEIRRETYYG